MKATSSKGLTNHMKINHLPEHEKKFFCKICLSVKEFTKRGSSAWHMKIHTRDKPFKYHLSGWPALIVFLPTVNKKRIEV